MSSKLNSVTQAEELVAAALAKKAEMQAVLDNAQSAVANAEAVRNARQAELESAANALQQAQEALEAQLALPGDGPSINLRINTADNAGTGPGYHWMGASPSGPLSIYLTHDPLYPGCVPEFDYIADFDSENPAPPVPVGISDPIPHGTMGHITASNLGGRKLLVRLRGGLRAANGDFPPDAELVIDVDAQCPHPGQ